MRRAFDKIAEGLRQALSFARDECNHEWREEARETSGGTWIVATCSKCNVRVSYHRPPTLNQ